MTRAEYERRINEGKAFHLVMVVVATGRGWQIIRYSVVGIQASVPGEASPMEVDR